VNRGDGEYYETMVKPLVDGRDVVFLGEADHRAKKELYARAACVLMPICWEEPFGLVMVEAMACGTPVIAFARGAAPELIVEGETGFLVHDVESMAAAVGQVDRIDPRRCREQGEAHFDVPVMVRRYLDLYDIILAESVRVRPLAATSLSPSASPAGVIEEAVA